MDDKASARVQTLEVVVSSDQATVTESLFFAVTEVNQPPHDFANHPRPDLRREHVGDRGSDRRLHRPRRGPRAFFDALCFGRARGLGVRASTAASGRSRDRRTRLVEQPLEVQLTATEASGVSVSVSFTLYVTNANDPVTQTRAFEPVQESRDGGGGGGRSGPGRLCGGPRPR